MTRERRRGRPPTSAARNTRQDLLDAALEFATTDPEHLLPELVRRLTDLWCQREARLFTSVLAREGLGAGNVGGLSVAVAQARSTWHPLFERWRDQRRLRADIPVEQLVWEFFTPLVTARFLT